MEFDLEIEVKFEFEFEFEFKLEFKFKFEFEFKINFEFEFEFKNSWSNTCTESAYQKYNSFFDLKTKRILKTFHFSCFNFITKIEK